MTDVYTLDTYDLHWAVHRLPKAVRDLMKDHATNIVVAGGYIRSLVLGEPPNDIDCFVPNASLARTFAHLLAGGDPVIETENAFTVKNQKIPVQFIHRWTYPNPYELLASFDFTIACAAVWYDKEWKGVAHPKFYSDLAARRLIYLRPNREEEPGGSLLRVLKFTSRGFKIPMESLAGVLGRLYLGVEQQTLDPHNRPSVGQSESALLGLLRDVDPVIDPDHIFHLTDQDEKK